MLPTDKRKGSLRFVRGGRREILHAGSRGRTKEREEKEKWEICASTAAQCRSAPLAAGQRRRSAADREAGDPSLGVIGASRTGPFTQSTPFFPPISPDKIAPCFHLPSHLSCASLVFGAFGTREASAGRGRKDAEGNGKKEKAQAGGIRRRSSCVSPLWAQGKSAPASLCLMSRWEHAAGRFRSVSWRRGVQRELRSCVCALH